MLALLALSAIVFAGPGESTRLAPRRPVAPPTIAPSRFAELPPQDPVVARIRSLLAGDAVRRAGVDIVPLYARTPSEAAAQEPGIPEWPGARLELRRAAAGVVRVTSQGPASVLLVPGMFLRVDADEYRILQVDTVPAGGTLHAPVREGVVRRRGPHDPVRGILAPTDAARASLGGEMAHASGAESVRGTGTSATYAHLARDAESWFSRPDRAGSKRGPEGTCVGCVILVGGKVLSGHVFASHALFRDAWTDILTTALIEQRAAVRSGVPVPILGQRAERGNPRGRALLVLRTLTAERGRLREIPGGGLRWVGGGRSAGYLAQGLVSAKGRVLYAGLLRIPPEPKSATKEKKPPTPQAEPEEDPTRRRGGRYNPFGGRKPGSLPGGTRDPLLPPR